MPRTLEFRRTPRSIFCVPLQFYATGRSSLDYLYLVDFLGGFGQCWPAQCRAARQYTAVAQQ